MGKQVGSGKAERVGLLLLDVTSGIFAPTGWRLVMFEFPSGPKGGGMCRFFHQCVQSGAIRERKAQD